MVVGPLSHLHLYRTNRAAGVIIVDPEGRLLMVHDRLRREWSYPAGYVEHGESARAGAVRELSEEVNLELEPGRLKHLGTEELKRPLGELEFTTFTAIVTSEEIAQIRRQALELTDLRWVTPAAALELTSARLKPRLRKFLAV